MKVRTALLATVVAVVTMVTTTHAQSVLRGRVKVIDGDSFEIGDVGVRLHGIDAPEGRQPCTRGNSSWRCGEAAAEKLRELTRGREVECRQRDVDDYGRIVAVCRSGNIDLGEEMVRSGYAFAYTRYSTAYTDEEREARAARRGIFAGTVEPPWEWRRESARDSEPRTRAQPNRDCRIKGNINRAGERIYHVPGSPSYDETAIDENDGERWFCSEAEARRAGWRAPRNRRSAR